MELANGVDIDARGAPVLALHQVVLAALGELQVDASVRTRSPRFGDREFATAEIPAHEVPDFLP